MDTTSKRRKISKNDDEKDRGLSGIHEDLLVKILLKLPVKYVVRCRSVSKLWYALTTTPYFFNKHLLHHHRLPDQDHSGMIFTSCVRNPTPRTVISLLLENNIRTFPFWFLKKQELFYNLLKNSSRFACKLLESSNGLVCFFLIVGIHNSTKTIGNDEEKTYTYQRFVIVWNPATSDFRIIPKPNANSNIPFKNQDEKDDITRGVLRAELTIDVPCIGFDFVHRFDDCGMMSGIDYKLVRVFGHDDNNKRTIFRAQVFVQNTNSWEPAKNELKMSSAVMGYPGTCVTLNGVLYWKILSENGKCGIVSFDIHNEVFTVLKLPTVLENEKFEYNVFSWKNSLVIAQLHHLYLYPDKDYILKLWTLKNMKDPVWTLQFCLDSSSLPAGKSKKLLGGWQNGFVFAISTDDDEVNDGFVSPALHCSYDPETKTSTKLIKNKIITMGEIGRNYVPTLAPV